MIKERKTFEFMGLVDVEVQLRDDAPEGFREEALGGVYNEPCGEDLKYTVWFKGLPYGYALVHESWHLFCTIMAHIDNCEHSWLDLNSEIYAYNFHVLNNKILEIVTGMKWYKKLYDEREKEDGGK